MLAWLSADGKRLLAARVARSFGYGFLAVALGAYLEDVGYNGIQVGLVLSAALVSSAAASVIVGLRADAWGRRRMLSAFAILMSASGVLLLLGPSLPLVLLAVTVGTVSPTGGEAGPFLSVEQAMLPQAASSPRRTDAFALYNLAGNGAAALGALFSGLPAFAAPILGLRAVPFGVLFATYAVLGLVTLGVYAGLSPALEVAAQERVRLGAMTSRRTVSRLSLLFATDAFGGGFALQSFVAFWFASVYGVEPVTLAAVFFTANVLTSVSYLAAARLASRFGLLNTMVFTHLPSNVLLMLVPLLPTLPLALAAYLGRMSLSQMDVPTRQAYTMAVVPREERTAAASFTTIARNVGNAAGPGLGGAAFAAWIAAPFLLAGAIKIAYDVTLYATFRGIRPPPEVPRSP